MLSSLINFSARQDDSALQNIDPHPVKGMVFYLYMLGFYKTLCLSSDMRWNFIFLSETRKKLAERMREAECEPVLEIAGVSCLVYSHRLQAGGRHWPCIMEQKLVNMVFQMTEPSWTLASDYCNICFCFVLNTVKMKALKCKPSAHIRRVRIIRLASRPPTHYAIICIVRMRITIYTLCESIRKIAKDILISKAGEERLATLPSIVFWVVLARH